MLKSCIKIPENGSFGCVGFVWFLKSRQIIPLGIAVTFHRTLKKGKKEGKIPEKQKVSLRMQAESVFGEAVFEPARGRALAYLDL